MVSEVRAHPRRGTRGVRAHPRRGKFEVREVGPNTVVTVPTETLVRAEHEFGGLARRMMNDRFLNAQGRRVIAHELKEHNFA